MHGQRIWHEIFGFLGRAKSKLSLVWHSLRAKPAEERAGPKRQVWPVPLPFPEMFRRGAKRSQKDGSRKLGLNFVILVMNFLACGDRHWSCVCPGLGTPLNKQQWGVVKQFTSLVDEWNGEEVVDPEAMGRTASKVESIEELLRSLESEASAPAKELRSYLGRAESRLSTSRGERAHPGRVVGKCLKEVEHPAKPVQPSRLQFWKEPSFDPLPFLDQQNQESYLWSLDLAKAPEDAERPPKVRVRCSLSQRIKLLEKLDSCGRLKLARPSEVRAGFECGMFTVGKDGTRDRLILDARPPDTLEETENRWIKSLGAASQLNHFFSFYR